MAQGYLALGKCHSTVALAVQTLENTTSAIASNGELYFVHSSGVDYAAITASAPVSVPVDMPTKQARPNKLASSVTFQGCELAPARVHGLQPEAWTAAWSAVVVVLIAGLAWRVVRAFSLSPVAADADEQPLSD